MGSGIQQEKLGLYFAFDPVSHRVEIRKGTLAQQIESRIRVLVGVLTGEVPMSPQVGSIMGLLEFDKMRDVIALQSSVTISTACTKCIPEIIVRGVTADPDPNQAQTVHLAVVYSLRAEPNKNETVQVQVRNWGVSSE